MRSRASSTSWRAPTARRYLRELASYADQAREGREPRRYAHGRRAGRPGGGRPPAPADHRHPGRVDPRARRADDARPRNVIVLPVLYEGQVKAVHRAGLARRVHRLAPGLPRAAHRQHHRRGAQHHRGHDAHRGPAEAVAAARRRAADAADRAAADQRGAGQQGEAARRAERRGRAQEPGDRAGAARAGGEGGGAGAHLALQVRVPGQHVARAAHAAQQHPDPRPAAVARTPTATCPTRQVEFAKTIHGAGHRPAQSHQRHPRPVEDRVRHGHGGVRGAAVHAPARDDRAQLPPRGRERASCPSPPTSIRASGARSPPTPSACCRC